MGIMLAWLPSLPLQIPQPPAVCTVGRWCCVGGQAWLEQPHAGWGSAKLRLRLSHAQAEPRTAWKLAALNVEWEKEPEEGWTAWTEVPNYMLTLRIVKLGSG